MGLFSSPQLNTGPAQGYMDTLKNLGTNLGSQGNVLNGQNNTFNTDWTNSLNNYADYLGKDSGTQQENAAQVANAERGASEGFDRARANTSANLASRGISLNSGIGAGALAGIDASQATNNANVQNEVGQANINRNAENKATLANLWGGASNTVNNRVAQNEQQQENVWQNLFNDSNTLSQEQEQADQANNQAFSDLLGAAGTFAGGVPWASIFSKGTPKAA